MSKPKVEHLRLEDQSKAITHSLMVHAAFMKLVNEALYPKTETSN